MQVSNCTSMPGFVKMRNGITSIPGYLGDQTSLISNKIAVLKQKRLKAKSPKLQAEIDIRIAQFERMLASTNSTLNKVMH